MLYELVVMDANFEALLTFDDFESLIWVRKYYEVGTFELHCSAEYLPELLEGEYLYCADLPELGVLESVRYEREGWRAVVTGRFAESLLHDRVILETGTGVRTATDWVRKWLGENATGPADAARRILRLMLAEGVESTAAAAAEDVRGKSLLESVCSMLKTEEMGLRVRYDPRVDTLTAEIWRGKDRTENQNENTLAIFSDEDETANTESYTRNRQALRNFAYVCDGEKQETLVTVDKTDGVRRRELWVQASVQREDKESTDVYAAKLRQNGHMELGKHPQEECVDAGAAQSDTLIYGVDYDLGDKCTYRSDALGLAFDVRVEGVTVTIENGSLTARPSLGNDRYL